MSDDADVIYCDCMSTKTLISVVLMSYLVGFIVLMVFRAICYGSVMLFVNCIAFICDLDCPYRCLTEGPVEQRLSCKENKLILLNYLLSEMQAARVLAARAPCLNNDFSNISTSDTVLSLLCKSIFVTVVFYWYIFKFATGYIRSIKTVQENPCVGSLQT